MLDVGCWLRQFRGERSLFLVLTVLVSSQCFSPDDVIVVPQDDPTVTDEFPTTAASDPMGNSVGGLSTGGGTEGATFDGEGPDFESGDAATTASSTDDGPPSLCGNGVVDVGEACDDRLNAPRARCRSGCVINVCGDGDAGPAESCDDRNLVSGDGCTANCVSELCGDGTVQNTEWCDDGNLTDGDGCSARCTTEHCGNAVGDFGEACDDGTQNGTYGFCRVDCSGQGPSCGDGQLDPGFEDCEPGAQEVSDCVALPERAFDAGAVGCQDCQYDESACIDFVCGNGVIDPNEDCESSLPLPVTSCSELNESQDQGLLGCRADTCQYDTSGCENFVCGNGTLEPQEECDQQGFIACNSLGRGFDAGSTVCVSCALDLQQCSDCGNGTVEGSEVCDDGAQNGQYNRCRVDCTGIGSRCADGVVQSSNEECDPSAALPLTECSQLPGDSFDSGRLTCRSDCQYDRTDCEDFRCGNNVIEANERCEPALPLPITTCSALNGSQETGTLSCSNSCQYDTSDCATIQCGNNVLEPGEECDQSGSIVCTSLGRGFTSGNTTCTRCRYDIEQCFTCGDEVREGNEVCDDGTLNGEYGRCRTDCTGLGRRCGDGVVNASSGEECDQTGSTACSTLGLGFDSGSAACVGCIYDVAQCFNCGDGVTEGNEECDDGNQVADDACDNQCLNNTCNPVTPDCGPQEFCSSTSCGSTGVCRARPTASDDPTFSPVCGCNGMTYWNVEHANFLGALGFAQNADDISGSGECSRADAVECSRDTDCGAGGRCITEYDFARGGVPAVAECSVIIQRKCWFIPILSTTIPCPNVPGQSEDLVCPSTNANGTCGTRCEARLAGGWAPSPACNN